MIEEGGFAEVGRLARARQMYVTVELVTNTDS